MNAFFEGNGTTEKLQAGDRPEHGHILQKTSLAHGSRRARRTDTGRLIRRLEFCLVRKIRTNRLYKHHGTDNMPKKWAGALP